MASVKNSKISDKAFTKQYGEETVFSYGCDPNGEWEEKHYCAAPDCLDFDATIPPRCQVYVYRMTMTNEDGDVIEYSPEQMRMRCDQMGVKYVPVFEKFMIPATKETKKKINFTDACAYDDEDPGCEVDATLIEAIDPGEYVLRKVEKYFDGPDPIGKTHIREGVVARIVNRPTIAVYKHKNFSFKVLEGIAKDVADAPDMEEAQEEAE